MQNTEQQKGRSPSPEGQMYPEHCDQQDKGGDSPLYSALLRHHLEQCTQLELIERGSNGKQQKTAEAETRDRRDDYFVSPSMAFLEDCCKLEDVITIV